MRTIGRTHSKAASTRDLGTGLLEGLELLLLFQSTFAAIPLVGSSTMHSVDVTQPGDAVSVPTVQLHGCMASKGDLCSCSVFSFYCHAYLIRS